MRRTGYGWATFFIDNHKTFRKIGYIRITISLILIKYMYNCLTFKSCGLTGPAGPLLVIKIGPKLAGHINTLNTWRLILFSVKIADSSEEGNAKNGNIVEAYEYLVRNVYPVGASVARKRCIQRKGSEICCERYFKKKKSKACSFQFG